MPIDGTLSIKHFFSREDIREALTQKNFEYIYKEASQERNFTSLIPEVTQVFLSIYNNDINYLLGEMLTNGLWEIPEFFLYRIDLSEYTDKNSIHIPNGYRTLGYKAFSRCKGLKQLFIPNTVKLFYENVCLDCPDLTDVWYADTKEYYIRETSSYAENHWLGVPNGQVEMHFA